MTIKNEAEARGRQQEAARLRALAADSTDKKEREWLLNAAAEHETLSLNGGAAPRP